MTMSLVQTVTVGAGGAANIEFTTIPQDATDLLLVLSCRPTGTEANVQVYFNSDNTDANYSVRRLNGNGSTASSNSYAYPQIGYTRSDYTASTFASLQLYIPNYTSSVAKSFSSDTVAENNATTSNQGIHAGSWSGTSAISTLRIDPKFGTSWAQHTTASLYKIKKA